jgi:hypothetical protein
MTASDAPSATKASGSADLSEFALTFPQAEADAVRAAFASANEILEYGSGGSTVVAAQLGKRIISVESDPDWAERMTTTLAGISDQARVHYVDIGETRQWGYPKWRDGFERYHGYALSVWDRPDLSEPDLVLIDGRFRKACLAAVRMRAKRKTTVLFDDYTERDFYHAVEKIATIEETIGRMARFTVTPGPIPPELTTEVIGWFASSR